MSIPREAARSIHVPPSPLVRHVGLGVAASARGIVERRARARVVLVHGPSVTVEVRKPDGARLQGVVEDCCWTGAAVRFGYTDDPRIQVGQVGVVVVASPGLPELTLRARVTSAEPRVSGGTRYGLEFVDEAELERQVGDGWKRWFSRRRSLRFEPRDTSAASLYVEWNNGRSRGRVIDASISGVAVELDLEAARRAVTAGEIVLLLAFPGSGTMRLNAKVQRARQGLPTMRLGLEFVRDEPYQRCRERLEAWAERARAPARA